jgi:putative transposase
MAFVLALLGAARAALRSHTDLALENLALRQQLALLRHHSKRPRFGRLDRAFWVWLSKRWAGWREALHVVRPETVIRWHRQGFRAFWTWKSRRGRTGRPSVGSEVAELVRTMALANPLWGAPRIHGELLKLGFEVSQRTVARLMPRRPKSPSQTWRTFLQNHVLDLVSVDFFVVPTATFRMLYVFVVLQHHRRKVVHFNVTDSPTAAWTAQQIVEAFPDDSAPRYLLRDRDRIYGDEFRRRVQGIGIAEVLAAPRSPWQNPFVERVIGTIRRELLDYVIVVNEDHLRRCPRRYVRYYNSSRTHLALDKDAPEPRDVEPPDHGRIIALPLVGGLHHRYVRRADSPGRQS